MFFFFFSSRRRHTRCSRDWSSDVCSSDLAAGLEAAADAVYARIASGGPSSPAEFERQAEGFRRRQRESERAADLYALLFLGLTAVTIGGIALHATRQRGGYSARRGGRWDASGPVYWGEIGRASGRGRG